MSLSSENGRTSSLNLTLFDTETAVASGFASLVSLPQESTMTKSRRIQISQLDTVQSHETKDDDPFFKTGMRQKRWSFHTSNPSSSILKQDKMIKPIVSPTPKRSSSVYELTAGNSALDDRRERSGSSDRHALSSTSYNNYKHHHRARLLPLAEPKLPRSERDKLARYLEKKAITSGEMDMKRYPCYHPFSKRHKSRELTPRPDHLSNLPDEILLRILKLLPKPALGSLARTSHKFLAFIQDETLWKRICLMSKLLDPEHLMVILSRKPLYLRLARASISDPSNLSVVEHLTSVSQLAYLDLSSVQISQQTLGLVLRMSPNLVKLSLEHLTVSKTVIESMMSFAKTIEVLNLAMCYELDAKALTKFFSSCPRLRELNMGCIKVSWTPEELTEVVKSLPVTLQQLNISGFRHLFDNSHVLIIATNCPRLIELDISDSQEVQAKSIEYMLRLANLQHLGLSRCYGIDPPIYTLLASHKKLKYLDLFSLFKENSIRQLITNLPGIEINKFPFSAIARPTVGNKRSSIWLQRVRD